MAWPSDDLPNEWADGEDMNAAKMWARITQRLNQLRAAQQTENDRVPLTIASSLNGDDIVVNFTQTWPVAPNVQVTVQSAFGRFAAYISTPVTTTGFTVHGYKYDGSNVGGTGANITIAWLAVAST